MDRTEMLMAASSKLAEAVELLSAAGEDRLGAHIEDLIQQIDLLEGNEGKTRTTM